MKIRMKTLAAGPSGVMQPGDVYDLPAEVAQPMIQSGAAVALQPAASVIRVVEVAPVVVETAEAVPAPERAVSPRGKRTKK